MANLVVVNKVNTALKENIAQVILNVRKANPKAKIMLLESKITAENPSLIKGKKVLVVEDGPTVTHGEMPYGAGYLAAKQFGAKKILEPKMWAKGGLKKTFIRYPHLKFVLPALGYGKKQQKELEETINEAPCQIVLAATPIDLDKIIKINKPILKVTYEIDGVEAKLIKILKDFKIIN